MAHTEMLRKARLRKVSGHSKPYIDKDLQIQIPGLDFTSEARLNTSCSPIYSHYCQDSFIIPPEMAAIEAELNAAISEAQQSYDAWKKMQQQLFAEAKKFKEIEDHARPI